jgi:hypothetical protein
MLIEIGLALWLKNLSRFGNVMVTVLVRNVDNLNSGLLSCEIQMKARSKMVFCLEGPRGQTTLTLDWCWVTGEGTLRWCWATGGRVRWRKTTT